MDRLQGRWADGRTGLLSYELSFQAMPRCPIRETTKDVSDQTLLDNQTLQELLVGNRHNTRCCKCQKFMKSGLSFLKLIMIRSSHPEVFLEKGVLQMCSKFTGEEPCQSVISIKLRCNFIEITLWHGCSPVNFLDIFRTPFLKNTPGRQLLYDRTHKNDAKTLS